VELILAAMAMNESTVPPLRQRRRRRHRFRRPESRGGLTEVHKDPRHAEHVARLRRANTAMVLAGAQLPIGNFLLPMKERRYQFLNRQSAIGNRQSRRLRHWRRRAPAERHRQRGVSRNCSVRRRDASDLRDSGRSKTMRSRT